MTRSALLTLVTAIALTGACAADPRDQHRRYVESGDRFARAGRDAAAVIDYRNALRFAPDDDAVYRRLGESLTRLGRVEEAGRALEMADGRANGRPLPDDASALRTIVDGQPSHVGARLALAGRLAAGDAPAEAEHHLLAALAADPAREATNRALAALYVSTGRAGEAEARLRAAAAATPQRLRSRLALADFLLAQARWREVEAALDDAAADATLAAAVAVRRVAVADGSGRHAEARRELAALLPVQPTAEAWTLAAQFAYADGDLRGATDAAKQALALNPSFQPAQRLVERIRWQELQSRPPDRQTAGTTVSSR